MLIDFHAHAFPDKLAKNAVASLAARAHFTPFTDGTAADAFRLLTEQGVDRCVLLNIAVTPRSMHHVNDFAISLSRDPRAIPFGSVHPDATDAKEELARLQDAGIRGIKFDNEYQDFYVDDDRALPLYEECAKRGFILLFHGGADAGFAPPVKTPPARMARVCRYFPEAKIVVAHLGGQDMPDEAIEHLVPTNALIDTSFASRSVPLAAAERVIRAFGADRVLFGTDCPWDTPASMLEYLAKIALTEEEREKIYHRNARRLLGEL